MAQVGQREDLLERLLARLGGHAGRDPQPQRVEVAVERVGLAPAGPPHAGQVVCTKSSQLGQRVAGAGRRDVERQEHGQLLLRQRHGAAAARSRRSGSACPTSAAGRSTSRRPCSERPARAPGGPAGASLRLGVALIGRRGRGGSAITASVRSSLGHAEHGRRPEAPVDDGRDQHRQRHLPAGAASVRRCSISGIVSASRALRSQPPERSSSSCSATAGSRRPVVDLRDGAARSPRSAPIRRALGVRREDGQRRAVAPRSARPRRRRRDRARCAGRRARPRPSCRSPRARPGAGRSRARRR